MESQHDNYLGHLLNDMGIIGSGKYTMDVESPHCIAVVTSKPGTRTVASPKDLFYTATDFLASVSSKFNIDKIENNIEVSGYNYRQLQIIHQIYSYGVTGVMEFDPIVWDSMLAGGEDLRMDPNVVRKLRTTVLTLLDGIERMPTGDFAQRWLQRDDGMDHIASIVRNAVNQ